MDEDEDEDESKGKVRYSGTQFRLANRNASLTMTNDVHPVRKRLDYWSVQWMFLAIDEILSQGLSTTKQ